MHVLLLLQHPCCGFLLPIEELHSHAINKLISTLTAPRITQVRTPDHSFTFQKAMYN
jgi:hypothetical protein